MRGLVYAEQRQNIWHLRSHLDYKPVRLVFKLLYAEEDCVCPKAILLWIVLVRESPYMRHLKGFEQLLCKPIINSLSFFLHGGVHSPPPAA